MDRQRTVAGLDVHKVHKNPKIFMYFVAPYSNIGTDYYCFMFVDKYMLLLKKPLAHAFNLFALIYTITVQDFVK